MRLDQTAGRAWADFEVRGLEGASARVVLGARRRCTADPSEAEDEEDEEENDVTGWRYYWNRPWELKRAVVEWAKGLRDLGSAAVSGVTGRSQAPGASEELAVWDLE